MYVKFRPFLFEFIREMKMYYEIIIYSSATYKFNSIIASYIESKEGSVFSQCLSNEFCVLDDSKVSLKSLEILSCERKIEEMVCLDSSYWNFMLHTDNIVPISRFTCESINDNELGKLAKFLKKVATSNEPATEYIKRQVYSVQHFQ